MELWNTNRGYGFVARAFHVVIATLVIIQLSAGFWMVGLEEGMKADIYKNHKLSGMIILLLMLLRLLWRTINVLPDAPKNLPKLQVMLARGGQRLLYTLLILMPSSGWLMATLAGRPPVIPGIGEVWFPLASNKSVCIFGNPYPLAKLAANTHGMTAILIVILVAIHASFGLMHYYSNDGVFQRMFSDRT